MSQTPLLRDLANFVRGSYQSADKRPVARTLLGENLLYMRNKSNQLWSHYENEEVIIVSIHGANTLELNFSSIFAFLLPSQEQKITKDFCNKYNELINETKKVFLIGHSLGNFMIASCSLRVNKSLPTVMFAPYVPNHLSAVNRHIGTNPKFKKIFYKQDFFAKNILRMGSQVKNVLLFSNKNVIFNVKTRAGHSISLFTGDINKDFKQKIVSGISNNDSNLGKKIKKGIDITSKVLLDILSKRKLFGKILTPRKNAPPKIRKWISNNKNKEISKIVVCRKPVQSSIKNIINIITLGKFNKSLKGLHYDDIFHLYLYITIDNITWRIEKNAVVTVIKDKQDLNEDCMSIDINMGREMIELGVFMKNGEKEQDNFWSYDPKSNNCQNFATSLLVGNKFIKKLDKTYKFIKQDTEAIFRNNPRYLAKFGKTITDIAAVFDVLKEGR